MKEINPAQSLSADRHEATGAGFVRDGPRILIVSGPTASGKSDIAIQLARKFNGEIISADSRQVYRGMDIGTGKVIRDKVVSCKLSVVRTNTGNRKLKTGNYLSGGIRHWLLDIASPTRQYTVAHFKRDAQKAIRDITRRGKLPIICGGTGFWIDALVYGQSIPDVKPDVALRARLRKLTPPQLFARLLKLDPARAATIDRHNPVRLIRALEIVMTTGAPVPARTSDSPYSILYLGVERSLPELKRRIEKRLDARLKVGMVAEVRRLHASGVSWKRLEAFGLEYRWLARYLQKKVTRTEMRVGLLHDIIAYAKRQLTWLRRNPDVRWVRNAHGAENRVERFL